MRPRNCRHQLPVIFDGLRDSQVQELDRLSSATDKGPGLQERQWIKIWSIAFSCTQPPTSPFALDEGELEVYRFRRFWERHGENIIADVSANHGLQQYEIKDEERNLEVLYLLVGKHAADSVWFTQNPNIRTLFPGVGSP